MKYTYFVSFSGTSYSGLNLGHVLIETTYKINKSTWEDFLSGISKSQGEKIIILNIQLLEETPE